MTRFRRSLTSPRSTMVGSDTSNELWTPLRPHCCHSSELFDRLVSVRVCAWNFRYRFLSRAHVFANFFPAIYEDQKYAYSL